MGGGGERETAREEMHITERSKHYKETQRDDEDGICKMNSETEREGEREIEIEREREREREREKRKKKGM